MWLLHLEPGLDSVLQWPALLPLNSRDAFTLLEWTLPLVCAYAGLGMLRNFSSAAGTDASGSPKNTALAIPNSAGLHLQQSNRTLKFNKTFDTSDLRAAVAVGTMRDVAINGLWIYGLVVPVAAAIVGKLLKVCIQYLFSHIRAVPCNSVHQHDNTLHPLHRLRFPSI